MGNPSKSTLAKKTLDHGHILSWDTAMKFLLGGSSVVTLEAVSDGARDTYLIQQAVDVQKNEEGKSEKIRRQRWFVHLLVGADNTRSYNYLGCIDKKFGKLGFRTTRATANNKGASAENINRIGDVIRDLEKGVDNSYQTRIWHRGLCGRCAAPLTVPASIATGLGPVCAKELGVPMADTTPSAIEQLAALAPSEEDASVA